ncbi:MAG TPA: anthranilate/aminodeoxychorismate synthase component II, partial [Phycisphaerales bacterium]|nr:anthranilate/aminodeoxychorismate synthase component II [Phycisphaerales bacterium]
DNYDSFTWNLVQRLGELDPALDIRVVRNDEITADEAERLRPERIVVSPGPCSPREAGVSNDIVARFAGRVPVLGVCLGHQCIGFMNGMTVTRHSRIMHGKTSDIFHNSTGVFRGLPSPFTATRYHSLVILRDTVPPNGWEVSAWARDTLDDGTTQEVVMGVRRLGAPGDAPLEGVQFHPESFLTTEGPRLLANFLGVPAPEPARRS